MTVPLVIELQQLAQSGATDVSDLLRRAKVVASKLKLDDFDEWFEQELNGYPTVATNLPSYRIVSSRLMAQNPVRGLIPVLFEGDAKLGETTMGEHYSTAKVLEPVGKVALLVASKEAGELSYTISDSALQFLIRNIPQLRQMPPVRLLDRSGVAAILDAVRNRILKWSLDLERKGILGAEMSFTKDEEKTAAQVTINNYGSFGSFVHASGSTVTTTQHSPGSEVNVATGSARLQTRLERAIDAVRSLDSQTAAAIARLAEGMQRLPDTQRVDATDALMVIAEQSAIAEVDARMPKSVLGPVVNKVRDSLSLSADLVQLWTTFGPVVTAWLLQR